MAGRSFAGGAFDWLNAFSLMTGVALVFGYVLLGATWVIMKTEDITQAWARKVAAYALGFVGFFLAIVSIGMPVMNADVARLWFSTPNVYFLAAVPAATALLFVVAWRDLRSTREYRPFFSEHRHFSHELSRPGHQPLAVDRSFCHHLSKGGGGARIPIPSSGRGTGHAARGARLHRLLLLYIPWKGVP